MDNMSVDKKDLKIQALLEKVSSLTTNYENQAADFRVEITLLTQQVEELRSHQNAPDTAPSESDEQVYTPKPL